MTCLMIGLCKSCERTKVIIGNVAFSEVAKARPIQKLQRMSKNRIHASESCHEIDVHHSDNMHCGDSYTYSTRPLVGAMLPPFLYTSVVKFASEYMPGYDWA